MRFRAVLFLVAFFHYAFPVLPALAAPPIDFCEKNPDSPLCDPVDPDPDPVDPCVEDPASCPVDPEPEPDPCEVDPASCEPEPDPCEADPASCEPEPEPEPNELLFGTLNGTLRVKGRGFRKKAEGPVSMVLDEERFDLLSHATCLALGGTMTATRQQLKAEIFLDDPSESTFATLVAGLADEAAGVPPGNPIGQNLKIIVKLDESGNALLKIKGSVLYDGIGKVSVKAKYAGALEVGSIPEIPTCM